MAPTPTDIWVTNVRLTKTHRDQLHDLTAVILRQDDRHVSVSEVIRTALDLTLEKPDRLRRELVRRAGE